MAYNLEYNTKRAFARKGKSLANLIITKTFTFNYLISLRE